jgi:hypothetical protein
MKIGPRTINWFGLVAGVLILTLPFMGTWWVGRAGTGAVQIALSPFDINISFFGQTLQSSLVGLFFLFTKITFVIAGTFLILSSLLPTQWWSKRLFRFGVMKPFSQVIFFIILLVIGALFANILLPNLLSSILGGAGLQINTIIPPIAFIVVFVVSIYVMYTLFSRLLSKISRETEKSQLKGNIIFTSILIAMLALGIVIYQNIPPPSSGVGGAQVGLSIPYVSGVATSTVQIGNVATVTVPITLALTGVFWVAVATAVLGIIARIYNGRLVPPERKEEKKKIKVKPVEEKKILKVRPT